MHAVIPAAGAGTRLYPQTHTKPKAMVKVAGKPILGHLLDQLASTEIDDVAVVVGARNGDQIVDYATAAYGDRFRFAFPEQTVALGLGHGVAQARDAVGEEPMLVVLADMLFAEGYEGFVTAHRSSGADATIGVQEVDNPSQYGVVEFGDGDRITRLVEKPADPPSNVAISGLYAVEDTGALWAALDDMVATGERGSGGEFQLTDALQRMVESGCELRAERVSDWYDCGRPEPLLDANRVLLDRLDSARDPPSEDAVLVPPVELGADVVVESSVVGPYVSVDDGTTISDSVVRDSIVGRDATLAGATLERSLIGDNAAVRAEPDRLNLGANSRVDR